MKTKRVITAVFGTLLSVGIFGVVVARFCAPVDAFCEHPTVTQSMPSTADSEVVQLAPRYYKYSASALQQAQQSGEKVVLYFWAPWCSSCAALDVEIEKDPELVPRDMIVLRVDYDNSAALKKQYNVVIQHTFVQVDSNGQVLAEWVGGEPSDLMSKTK